MKTSRLILHFTRVCLLLSTAAVGGCAAKEIPAASLQEDCQDLASRLGFAPEGQAQIQEWSKTVDVKIGDVACAYSLDGSLLSISNYRWEEKPQEGSTQVMEPAAAYEIASTALRAIDRELSDSVKIEPAPPWNEKTVLVSVITEPLAFGYPTNGFAGRAEILVNRFTEKVAAIHFLAERTCDPPNIQISEAEAKRMAEDALARRRDVPDNVKCEMHLHYYVASGDEATPQGDFYRERNRARLCWTSSFYIESRVPGMPGRPYSGIVAIDSETGELLSVPD